MGIVDGAAAMLVNTELEARLEAGDIFVEDTWAKECISKASYDLRIADDHLILPNNERRSVGNEVKEFIIKPGDTCLVSTMERFSLAWNLVGNMSPKWSQAKRGLHVHTGSIVDPGFGLEDNGYGNWTPQANERVHFVLANLGTEPVSIRAGEKIATIQFHELSSEPDGKKASQSVKKVHDELFAHGSEQRIKLDYFRHQKVLEETMQKRLDNVEAEMRSATTGYQQVTMFGVYLLAAALLTIFGSLILQSDASQLLTTSDPNPFSIGFIAIVLLFLLAFPLVLLVMLTRSPSGKND